MAFTVAYLFVWALGAFTFVQLDGSHRFDGIVLLALLTLPSSYIVSVLHDLFGKGAPGFGVDLLGFLLFGALQYALIGYLFGMVVAWSMARLRTRGARES
jgi:hypothetical protein